MTAAAAVAATLAIDARCTACGLCLATCPEPGALTRAPKRPAVDQARCTGCLACIEVCPVDAIAWTTGGEGR
ncbi:MAG TPA: 4Fe-4S binding protein [Acidimicrobiales bacterium]|jgi:Pyruvate/2-oxoacid:ferredoxin oxidoreductase delta subunit|nr:4Fe-4S binding protein [Acidimicrobiales bacterium]